MITENAVGSSSGADPQTSNGRDLDGAVNSTSNATNGTSNGHHHNHRPEISLDKSTGKDGHSPLHPGEVDAGSHSRAVISHGKAGDGSLDVCIRVEKDQHDPQGHTQAYGFWIPALKYTGAGQMEMRKRDNISGVMNAVT